MERKVYTEIREIVNPEHSALIVWDVQKMLVNNIYNKEEFLKNINALIESARNKGMPIFFTKITPLPKEFESPARKYSSSKMKFNLSQLPKEMFELAIEPKNNEIVINKNTASVFIGTNFELMCRNAGIETLIIAGIATEIGVESTARDAANRGFYVVVDSDASSSSDKEAHERSLQNMKKLFDVLSTDDIIKAL
ncbi:MAG: cysteine hydrolase [Candidatus Parvarchaeota archaeon]|nr:cysteine hydrolase [Candidatus Parvarchaeota archaeon]MCW1294745.1 cysteine hydrolase [Candidatus Parvarchaeum tengchongense]MCW1295335.1 cysteine hydrolase [Candidatus Parvarchaeum tengchongense]MCW1299561.1 cysteine hydrolase [Candidatus Parvarchaeum tengchongense]MCW1311985.1 cysteine hydrolase [Candidatus Parvarchaeum tengchongense]